MKAPTPLHRARAPISLGRRFYFRHTRARLTAVCCGLVSAASVLAAPTQF